MAVNVHEHRKFQLLENPKQNNLYLVEDVVYRTYQNGKFVVKNVPYLLKVMEKNRKKISDEYLPFEVMEQLIRILKFMEKQYIHEVDYQQLQAFQSFMQTETKAENVEKVHIEATKVNPVDKDEVVAYVKRDWLDRVYEWHLQSKPRWDGTDGCKVAKGRLEFLRNKVEELTELHQEIIQLRYFAFEKGINGVTDIAVYTELHLSKANYYKHRKEALYWLGIAVMS